MHRGFFLCRKRYAGSRLIDSFGQTDRLINHSLLERFKMNNRTIYRASTRAALSLCLLACACQSQPLPPPAAPVPDAAPQKVSTVTPRKTSPVEPTPTTSAGLMLTTAPTATAADATGMMEVTPMSTPVPLTITILYNNIEFDQRLTSGWGFAALVEYRGETTLFDTGGNGPILMENMQLLGLNPGQIKRVVLSHAHGDHTGGLSVLLKQGTQPTVYLLPSFPEAFKRDVKRLTTLIETSAGQTITDGVATTGEMGQGIPEQALVIQTDQGLVILTGCAHPGIVAIVEQARQLFDDKVRLVLGGFHLGDKSRAEIQRIIEDFRRLDVAQVAPSHCTGELAITMFAEAYGDQFIHAGVGSVIRLDSTAP
jgi:7,8-dihydropterin-6-yl-methyl-4-(beta-D-ribofuranosyl)aminobenzene 5'-phosphate synthase